ncbi:MAG TPA: DUF4432 family protein, partial [Lacipirellulaceae bacterium]|nr:DUF4432 family protein [Lacipirellulaceae bacterium]
MPCHVLVDATRNLHCIEWQLESPRGDYSIIKRRLHCGVSEGVDLLEIKAERVSLTLIPTRGLSLLDARIGELPLGWQSPIPEPVHPKYVPLAEPHGYGFLAGPNELMFRCGLESLGRPDFTADGVLKYSLHGRIANLPVHYLDVSIDEDAAQVVVRGQIAERRFLRQKLLLEVKYVVDLSSGCISWTDQVLNLGQQLAQLQMMYHVNLGPPILQEGSRFLAPYRQVVPRDADAQAGVSVWNLYGPPQADYREQVYFIELAGDDAGQTVVMLADRDSNVGACLRFNVHELPCFTLWKNTQSVADGYVTGIQPGTSFPNPRGFEEQRSR